MNVVIFRRVTRVLLTCVLAVPRLAAQSSPPRTVHVFVALADNVNQGIVPVPAKLGKGDDPEHNLYWGAAGGVKTFFARSADWKLISQPHSPKAEVLERCVFKHRATNVYVVADAYQGDRIQQAIIDFLSAAAGDHAEEVKAGAGLPTISAGGAANLVAYIGHDGFMDFQLPNLPRPKNTARREAIVLACISKTYFAEALRSTGAHPLLWTTGLMAPEAYTLKDALDGWIAGESDEQIRERAAHAYDRYQKCGIKGARRLFVSGW
jgi:hypothetical protein